MLSQAECLRALLSASVAKPLVPGKMRRLFRAGVIAVDGGSCRRRRGVPNRHRASSTRGMIGMYFPCASISFQVNFSRGILLRCISISPNGFLQDLHAVG